MWALLITTVAAASADSLNPIAIAQQLLLQPVNRKKWHIWGFILGIALTNLTFGLVVYFEFAEVIRSTFDALTLRFPDLLGWLSIIVGVLLLIFIGYRLYTTRNQPNDFSENEKKDLKQPESAPGFWQLFGLGIISCAMELTSALPYIAYIAFIIQANLSTIAVISILVFYNILFSWPLIVLYFASVYYERYFNRIYGRLMTFMDFITAYLLPIVLVLLGIGLVLFGLSELI